MEGPAAHTLRKSERLCSKKDISRLFSEGKWGLCGHLRYCWISSGEQRPNRILVSVSKKYFKRAVKRNLLKRRMREAYRCQKALLDCDGVDFLLAWSSKDISDWQTLRDEVTTALSKIGKSVTRQSAAAAAESQQTQDKSEGEAFTESL